MDDTKYVVRITDSDGLDSCGIYCGAGIPEIGAEVEVELPDENGNPVKLSGETVEIMEVIAKRETYQEFADRNQVAIECESLGVTYWDHGDRKTERDSWRVTLRMKGREMVTEFHKGKGNRVKRRILKTSKPKYLSDVMFKTNKTLHDVEQEKLYIPIEPNIDEVLYCLASDAIGTENARCFEDWAQDYGCDADSRSAEKIYQACRKIAFELSWLLGETEYQKLLWETEEE